MSSSRGPLTTLSDDPSARSQLASWYTQGASDGFGDRLLMFDNAATGPLELLRVRPDFSFLPDFEAAVRGRLEQLASLGHLRGFAQARAVNHLENGEGLTVVSAHVPGTHLSELFQSTRPHGGMHPASTRWALGELVSSLAELHRCGAEIAHGALAPERIVITSDRHLVVTDYVFGTALANLRLPTDRLWSEFGIVLSPREPAVLDQRSDVVQLGLIVMSLVLGRRVSPSEYPRQLEQLLEEFTAASDRRAADVTLALRTWLEGALDPAGFESAIEAELALVLPVGLPESGGTPLPRRATPAAGVPVPPGNTLDVAADVAVPPEPSVETVARSRPVLHWVAAALALVVLVQGALIARLVSRTPANAEPSGQPTVDSASPGDAVDVPLSADSRSIRVEPQSQPIAPGAVLAMSQTPRPGLDPTLGAKPESPRSGGIRVISPVAVQIVEGERILGSSANGPVFTTPGVHQLDLINNVLGYRTSQTVRVVAGRVVPLQIEPPNGTISINAQPWAQVWIDGKAVGDTPLANLSVPLGEHEVVFRHPQFGERRQKAVVQAGGLTRVSATLNP